MGIIAFQHIKPNEALPDDLSFFFMNSLSFVRVYLNLRICTMARGKVVGDSKNIPPECVSSRDVLLLVLWRDTESEATCPTPSQVHSLEVKLKRPPGWWVESPVRIHVHFDRRSADTLGILAVLMNNSPSSTGCY
jgi:hypothetical protein